MCFQVNIPKIFKSNFFKENFWRLLLEVIVQNRGTGISEIMLKKKTPYCYCLVDSFPFKYMLFRGSPILTLVLNHLIGNTWAMGLWTITLKKYQLLSNQSLKHNSVHMPSLNLPSISFFFELRLSMFIINGYFTKSKRLYSLGLLVSCCFYISFYISKYHFLQLQKIIVHIWTKIFIKNFPFLTESTKPSHGFCHCSLKF